MRHTPEQVDPTVRAYVQRLERRDLENMAPEGEPQRMEPPVATRLGEIAAPTLVITGAEDSQLIQSLADAMVAGIRGARKAVIADAAHLPNMERPDEFNRLVLDFLAGVK